eukprot:6180570-Pleurochrysis_carterae.AAC.4
MSPSDAADHLVQSSPCSRRQWRFARTHAPRHAQVERRARALLFFQRRDGKRTHADCAFTIRPGPTDFSWILLRRISRVRTVRTGFQSLSARLCQPEEARARRRRREYGKMQSGHSWCR